MTFEVRKHSSEGHLMTSSFHGVGDVVYSEVIFVRLNGTMTQSVVEFAFSDDINRILGKLK